MTDKQPQPARVFPDGKLAYRVSEACTAIGIKRSKLYELIKAGRLAIKKDGGCTLILRSELERYLGNLPAGATA
jgi:excisionase family DNA binding protein